VSLTIRQRTVLRSCAKPNSEVTPVSGHIVALVVVLILCAAVVLDMPRLVALILS
jgi:hypothetical protein